MGKLDLRARLKHLYQPSAKEPALVDVPEMGFLMIDGAGDPNSSVEYARAVEALYSAAYTIKFKIKKGPLGIDYPVMALEGLWWAEDMSSFVAGNKSAWLWTMMIMQPDFVTEGILAEAKTELAKKKDLPTLGKLRLERFEEGRCAQILHRGPFSSEGPTIELLHGFIAASGLRLRGKHHEIYLSDPRKAKPDAWRTVIRQPAG
ncbi:MAG TPA: GyrI-like domain-containing protein [Rectinemataceae bacterium]